MQIFEGQGAQHSQLGYCVITKVYSRYKVTYKDGGSGVVEDLFGLTHSEIESIQPLGPKFVVIQTTHGIVSRVDISYLVVASLPEEILIEIQKKIESYPEQRFSRTLVETKYVPTQYTKFNQAETGPRTHIKLETDMNNGLIVTGGKCEHGVYIPTWASFQDDSPYCSNCHPHSIIAKKGEYKA